MPKHPEIGAERNRPGTFRPIALHPRIPKLRS